MNNRQFLPDSYTRFQNKIGLADENGDLLSTAGKIELVFPYKDCVLEGGQTKEDQNRSEILYNKMLPG
ncbi:MAG: site-specific DNA-methyltransferase [Saccharofermentanales bacterium]|nr:site-specific DNA-methyltransferase [Ruminiclostridium sp.]